VREHFFTVHDLPHLACLITYQDPTARPADAQAASPASGSGRESRPAGSRPGRDLSDLLAGLSPEDRVLFGPVREWRAARARRDGVPPYVLALCRTILGGSAEDTPSDRGIPFLGWMVHRGTLRVQPGNLRRYLWRLRQRRWEMVTGRRSLASYRAGVELRPPTVGRADRSGRRGACARARRSGLCGRNRGSPSTPLRLGRCAPEDQWAYSRHLPEVGVRRE
jgi:hypothetical protein